MSPSAPPLPSLLKVLSDPVRLRILSLLALQELSVGELTAALGMAQSRVSNHLRVLREAQLLAERHVGTSTYLQPAFARGAKNGQAIPARLWQVLEEGLADPPQHAADRLRLEDVLSRRHANSREFFDRVAGEWDEIGARFRTGQARQRAVANLLPPGLVLADLGCGTGYLARSMLGLASKLICVDRSPGMLDEAKRRLAGVPAGAPGTRVEFRQGELDALPIGDDELDGAVAAMVLHHLPELDGPLREMRRTIRPGGTAVVLELAPHREVWLHEALGDLHLGLESKDVVDAFGRAGFEDLRVEPVDDRYLPTSADPAEAQGAERQPASLPLYIVRGRVPSGRTTS